MRCANRSPLTDHRSLALTLEELDWIPRPKILALRRLGIETVENLLTHFPLRHEDRAEFPHFLCDESVVPVRLSVEQLKTSLSRFRECKITFKDMLRELNPISLSDP